MSNATMRALVVGTDELAARRRGTSAVFARTPLDMIQVLERAASQIAVVVLAGDFAQRDDIIGFLRDAFPALPVHHDSDCADGFLCAS